MTNDELFERARRVIPGGVNSPVRAFRAVGGTPRFIVRGDGPYIFDAEGKRYIDYIGSWGPMILGHRHPAVQAAVHAAVEEGLSFGAPTEREIELAEAILDQALDAGFRPGMGNVVPDRFFWALPSEGEEDGEPGDDVAAAADADAVTVPKNPRHVH